MYFTFPRNFWTRDHVEIQTHQTPILGVHYFSHCPLNVQNTAQCLKQTREQNPWF